MTFKNNGLSAIHERGRERCIALTGTKSQVIRRKITLKKRNLRQKQTNEMLKYISFSPKNIILCKKNSGCVFF